MEKGNAGCGWIKRGCRGGTWGNGRGTGRGRGRVRGGREVAREGRVEARGDAWRRDRGPRGRAGGSPTRAIAATDGARTFREPRARARRAAFGASRENTRAERRNDAHLDVCVCVDRAVSSAVGCAPRSVVVGRGEPIGRPGTTTRRGLEIGAEKPSTIRQSHRSDVSDFSRPDPRTFARALNPFSASASGGRGGAVRPPAPASARDASVAGVTMKP